MKTLVVYFSRKGYTARLAREKAEELGADLMEIRTTERTQGILGFWWCGRFGMHRWGMPIEAPKKSAEDYDKVIFCSPIWVFTFCAPIRRYAESVSGKVKAAEYIFVHFSLPMRYEKAAKKLDGILNTHAESYKSVCCMWGRFICKREFKR